MLSGRRMKPRTFEARPGMVHAALLLATHLAVSAPASPEHETGARAGPNVVLPPRISSAGLPGANEVRSHGAGGVSVIYRFSTNAANEAETAFRSSFGDARERFLDQLEAVLGTRMLAEELTGQGRFRQVVGAFQEQEKLFPLSFEMARLWAGGQSGDLVREEWGTILRSALGRLIRSDSLSPEAAVGASLARLIPARFPKRMIDPPSLDRETLKIVPVTEIVSLSRARSEFIQQFPPQDLATARFLAGFLSENCVLDSFLSTHLGESTTKGGGAVKLQPPGGPIAMGEATVIAKTKPAPNEPPVRLPPRPAKLGLPEPASPSAGPDVQSPVALNRWTLTVAGVLIGILLAGWFRLRGRFETVTPAPMARREGSGNPGTIARARRPNAVSVAQRIPLPSGELLGKRWEPGFGGIEEGAGRRLMRAELIAAWSRSLMSRIVERLLAERVEWFTVQERAERELAELEQRLARARAPLEERLQAYERRIAELENQLAKKGEENRELLQATISTARRRLESGRSRDRLPWN